MGSPVPRPVTTSPGGRRHSHKWTRQRVVLPRELVMGDTLLRAQMQVHVRQFMAERESAMPTPMALKPNLDPETARYTGKAGRLFDLLDRSGLGMLTIQNLSFLETWRMPTYLYHQPEPARWKAVQDKLMEVNRNALKAWRKLDKDGSMRLSYEEFRDIAANMASKVASSPSNGSGAFPRTEAEVAAAWRAIDKECVGYIQLRDWDLESHRNLSEFKSWCDRNHGGVVAAFRFLDGGGMEKNSNAKLSEHELRNCTKGPDPCTADIEFLFDGLDVHGHWALSENDVQFLDQWDFEWEQWQEEAAAKKRQQQRASSP
eukprot:TRINITY_DN3569_c0_g1_i7.p1 TRINITY_DN3569_c0_g1~~TRINITY_DN3569_c0_g1_i7.p1  ORF type:complete len:348 (+),score=64.90 TRINITY_DN3569_c0_g1_i7:97-1044(+)